MIILFGSAQGSATSWTEPATNDITWGFALFFGGFVQLLAGQVRSVYAIMCQSPNVNYMPAIAP